MNNIKRITILTVMIAMTICFIWIMPVSIAEAYLGDRTLNYGMKGYDVTQLQRDLGYLGYKVGPVDGIFGWQTASAVKEFKLNNGLKSDGVVDKQTAYSIIKQVSRPAKEKSAADNTEEVSRGMIGFSRQDIYDLARLVHGEARGEPFEGQVAVAAVVLNRLKSPKFGDTVREVIFEPGAFTAVSDKQFYNQPDQTAYEAVRAALNGWDPTGGAIYYWNPATATNKWVWSRKIIGQIGRHVFAI